MWPFDHVFHTYGWPGPFGWLARATPGNLAASAIAFTAGWLVGLRRVVKKLHTRLDGTHARLDHIIEHHPDIPPLSVDATKPPSTPV